MCLEKYNNFVRVEVNSTIHVSVTKVMLTWIF